MAAGEPAIVNQELIQLIECSSTTKNPQNKPTKKAAIANSQQQPFSFQAATVSKPSKTHKERKRPVYLDWSDKNFFDPVDESKAGRGGPKAVFIPLLYQILEDAETDNFTDICSWLPHGRAFAIHKPKEFAKMIMPKYSNKVDNAKYSSFRRQLNLYGFLRLTGKDFADNKNSYYHEMFLRGRGDLSVHMARIKVNGKCRRAAYDLESQPKLSELPLMPPAERQSRWEELRKSESDKSFDEDGSPEKQVKSMKTKSFATVHGTEENAQIAQDRCAAEHHIQMSTTPAGREAEMNHEPRSIKMDAGHPDDSAGDNFALAEFLKDLFA